MHVSQADYVMPDSVNSIFFVIGSPYLLIDSVKINFHVEEHSTDQSETKNLTVALRFHQLGFFSFHFSFMPLKNGL